MDYRKDIDGLRAIAVLLVVFDHMKIPYFEGGFIGVDVFFAISGFLIASILINQLDNGTFSFKKFYLKRIQRIFPVLIFIIAVSTAINLIVLFPEQLEEYLSFVPYAIFAIGNFAALNLDQGYFDQSVERHQLLHTWSLGVEEQFYILIPLLLFLLWKVGPKRYKNIIIVSLFLLSLAISIYFVQYTSNKDSNYYMLHTRFFEIFIGVTLAYFYKNIPKLKNKNLAAAFALLSILGLIVMGISFNGSTMWPGINALLVVLCVAFLIYLGSNESKNYVSERILGNTSMTFIGKISYSLYLWHWIAISLLFEIGFDMEEFSIPSRLFFIGLFLIPLSYLSWRFIENVFRYNTSYGLRTSLAVWILIPLLFSITIIKIGDKYPSLLYSEVELDQSTYKLVSGKTRHKAVRDINLTTKELTSKHRRNEILIGDYLKKFGSTIDHEEILDSDVLIIGNSHFNPFKKYLDQQLREAGLIGHVMEEKEIRIKVYAEKNVEKIYSTLLKDKKYLLIIVRHVNSKFGSSNKDWREWLIDKALDLGVTPIIMVPGIEIEKESIARKNYYQYKLFGTRAIETMSVDKVLEKIPSLSEAEELFLKYGEKIRWLDFKPLLTKNDQFLMWFDQEFVLFDKHHLTRKTGLQLGLEFSKRYGNIFTQKWKQPTVMFNSIYYSNDNTFFDKKLLFKNAKYNVNFDEDLGKIFVRKKDQGKIDRQSNFFLHVFPKNVEDLPERRKKSGFDNLNCRKQFYSIMVEGESYFNGEFYLPEYEIDSIKVGHYDMVSGDRNLDVNLKLNP